LTDYSNILTIAIRNDPCAYLV